MKIITLWQPYPTFISLGFKLYETRSRQTRYRGKLAIHAGKRIPKLGEMTVLLEAFADIGKEAEFRQAEVLLRDPKWYGGIVAIVDLVDCKMMNMAEEGEFRDPFFEWIDDQTSLEIATGWWKLGHYAWKLNNVVALPEPIYCRGVQGLRDVPYPAFTQIPTNLVR